MLAFTLAVFASGIYLCLPMISVLSKSYLRAHKLSNTHGVITSVYYVERPAISHTCIFNGSHGNPKGAALYAFRIQCYFHYIAIYYKTMNSTSALMTLIRLVSICINIKKGTFWLTLTVLWVVFRCDVPSQTGSGNSCPLNDGSARR